MIHNENRETYTCFKYHEGSPLFPIHTAKWPIRTWDSDRLLLERFYDSFVGYHSAIDSLYRPRDKLLTKKHVTEIKEGTSRTTTNREGGDL